MFYKPMKVILKIQKLQGRQNVLKASISPRDLAILLQSLQTGELLYTEFSEMLFSRTFAVTRRFSLSLDPSA